MATPCFESMGEYYFGRIFGSKYCLYAKRQCPYWQILFLGMGDFCLRVITHTDSFEKPV